VAAQLEQLDNAQAEIRAAFYESMNGTYTNGEAIAVFALEGEALPPDDGVVLLSSLALPPPLTESDLIAQIDEKMQVLEMLIALTESFEESRAQIQPHISNHPTIWPVRTYISSGFGSRQDPFTGRWTMHNGIDIPARHGTPIVATGGGTVVLSGWVSGGFGNKIIIDHGFGIRTVYAHNQVNLVSVGQRVERGELIGRVGSTGATTGPHVHYEVHVNGRPVNPRSFLLE